MQISHTLSHSYLLTAGSDTAEPFIHSEFYFWHRTRVERSWWLPATRFLSVGSTAVSDPCCCSVDGPHCCNWPVKAQIMVHEPQRRNSRQSRASSEKPCSRPGQANRSWSSKKLEFQSKTLSWSWSVRPGPCYPVMYCAWAVSNLVNIVGSWEGSSKVWWSIQMWRCLRHFASNFFIIKK